ncbi:MAG: hypothetical protein E7J29_00320 [Veillonella sp.]|uniref:hypothetical protein n=1 Tax=Veillonella sp. TaxID=1926307 RepID=UPI0020559305|nr:hypothetical protein [Veillonella sp.]MDU7875260.1 hypothetical protein [Veillonella sp.]MDU7935951.1 hypothetical protein [Veillonella sp.]DAN84465.1 MAG TPA: hypothetical protein [Caudoviricetes sp.]
MNAKIEIQPISPEQREKIIEDLKLGMRNLIGQPINRKSQIDFSNIIKDTMKKNKVTIIFDDDGNVVMPSK